jgi:threonine dehydrogenase-like Zn-dependent dehydrogenase
MKAAVLVGTGTIEMQEVATPALGPDDVLIKNAYAGVCGSDLHAFRGKHPFRKPPVILWHEFAGTVAECGSQVTECRPGDRVTVMPLVPCQTCRMCRMGRQNICLHVTGMFLDPVGLDLTAVNLNELELVGMAQDALTLLADRAEDAVKVLLEIPC